MPSEAPRQIAMFTGELVDNRTERQKHSDKARERPQQAAMFSSRDIAQFGVKAKPLMPLANQTRMVLIREDPRTPEERERDLQLAAEEKTDTMFQESIVSDPAAARAEIAPTDRPNDQGVYEE